MDAIESRPPESDNTSGQGPNAAVPQQIQRWNWGAFLLSWIWGIAHNTWIALLAFVPVVGIVMPFVLGARGNVWAWQNKRWDSVEAFLQAQRRWARWGVVVWCAALLFCVGIFALVFGIAMMSIKHSDAYKQALDAVQDSPAIVQELGEPIEAGWPSGSVNVNNVSGEAELSFSVEGPRGQGRVHVKSSRDAFGRWQLDEAQFLADGDDEPIDFGE